MFPAIAAAPAAASEAYAQAGAVLLAPDCARTRRARGRRRGRGEFHGALPRPRRGEPAQEQVPRRTRPAEHPSLAGDRRHRGPLQRAGKRRRRVAGVECVPRLATEYLGDDPGGGGSRQDVGVMLGEHSQDAGAVEEGLRAARAADHRRHRAEPAIGLVCLARECADVAAASRLDGRGNGKPALGEAKCRGIPVQLDDRAVVTLGECLGPSLDPAEPRSGGGEVISGPACRGRPLRHCLAGRGQAPARRRRGRCGRSWRPQPGESRTCKRGQKRRRRVDPARQSRRSLAALRSHRVTSCPQPRNVARGCFFSAFCAAATDAGRMVQHSTISL